MYIGLCQDFENVNKGGNMYMFPNDNKYGCRCKASIVKRRGQVIYELVREPDV